MDWPESTEPLIVAFPRGRDRDGLNPPGLAEDPDPLRWTSRYGSLVTTIYGIGTVELLFPSGLPEQYGIKTVNIPLSAGSAKVLPMFMAGDAHVGPVTTAIAGALLGEPSIQALAVGAPQRLEAFPNVPTYAEAGFPDMYLPFWTALWAPAAMPKDALEKLREATNKVLASRELQDAYKKVHLLTAPPMGAADTAKFFDDQREFWGKLITSLGLAK